MPVYKIKSGKWSFKISYKGTQVYRSGFNSKSEAELAESRFLVSLSDEKALRKKKVFTDELCIKEFETSYKKRYKTTTAYTYIILFKKHVTKFFSFEKSPITNLNVLKFVKYVNALKTNNASKIMRLGQDYVNYLTTLKLTNGVSFELFSLDKQTYLEKTKIDYYDFNEYQTFRSFLKNPKYVLLFDLLYFYGLRVGELRGLKHNDFNFTKKLVFVKRSVTNKTGNGASSVVSTKSPSSVRTYPLIDIIKEDYLNYFGSIKSKDKFLFEGTRDNLNIGETPIRVFKSKTAKAAKLKDIRIHDFRHSCASYLLNNGMDYLQVSSWLGHKSPAVTLSIYSHLFPSRKKEIADFLNKNIQKIVL
jgi:integrase